MTTIEIKLPNVKKAVEPIQKTIKQTRETVSFDGVNASRWVKKNVLGRYVKALESMDPKLAEHILNAQKEFFLAGKTFWEIEAEHAEKALNRIRRKAKENDEVVHLEPKGEENAGSEEKNP